MPPTATLEEIKAHQQRVEKGEITPENLPPCPRCSFESAFFKVHALRKRQFLVLVAMLIESAFCSLVRFKCPGCGKTITHYPDFAIAHKHYTRQTVMGFAANYVNCDDITYEQATIVDKKGTPGYQGRDATLAASTIHRWVTTAARFVKTCQVALDQLLQQNLVACCQDLGRQTIPKKKYRSNRRKQQLIACLRIVTVDTVFHATLGISIFTEFAIGCGFS